MDREDSLSKAANSSAGLEEDLERARITGGKSVVVVFFPRLRPSKEDDEHETLRAT